MKKGRGDHPLPKSRIPLLITIEGPTAIGKTAVAIEIARYFETEIISTDSRQFFREMQIGTAMPSSEELQSVPHHFCAEKSIHENFTVFQFEREAIQRLEGLFKVHDCVIATGGSGLYMQALIQGIDDLPDPSPELRLELQQRFDKEGIGFLQEWLFHLDPDYYNQVDLQNPVRLMRAIEVCLVSGKTYSSQRTSPKKQRPFQVIRLGLCMTRPQLADRISFRIRKMMEMGFLEEARLLHAYRGIVPLKTIGYPELFDVLEGKSELETAIGQIAVNTRRYAKKQMTWLQAQQDIIWFHPAQTECIKRFLLQNRTR